MYVHNIACMFFIPNSSPNYSPWTGLNHLSNQILSKLLAFCLSQYNNTNCGIPALNSLLLAEQVRHKSALTAAEREVQAFSMTATEYYS